MKIDSSSIALILVNTLPIIGILFLGWTVFSVLIFYWMESFVIGFFNIVKIYFVPLAGIKEIKAQYTYFILDIVLKLIVSFFSSFITAALCLRTFFLSLQFQVMACLLADPFQIRLY